jgi:hypothetical protein
MLDLPVLGDALRAGADDLAIPTASMTAAAGLSPRIPARMRRRGDSGVAIA